MTALDWTAIVLISLCLTRIVFIIGYNVGVIDTYKRIEAILDKVTKKPTSGDEKPLDTTEE